ncbi:MAG: hypothetical protein HYT62_03285 [Candidatus Yanofskybacteria bacterium]|nr:hypothetical protein [Candidatus Yanofskybacteria bacterium]
MSAKKKAIADLLFGVQIVGALVFCGAYFLRSLHDVTGSSLVQFGLVATYLLFHLALGVGAHRASPSRVTRQTIATYAIWFVLISAIISAAATNPAYRWNERETTQLLTAAVLTVIVLAATAIQRRKLSDPMVKASFAIAYKSVPQVLLAWKFLAEGASGTPGLSVVVGHLTILIRLGQIYFMVREAGWDRNRVWLAVSETVNELSWVVATAAWLMV